MKKIFALLVLVAMSTQLTAQERPLVFTHVTVIDVTGTPPQPDMTLVVTGNRITELTKSSKAVLPKDAQVIDATAKFLIPGLWDMHVHLSFYGETAFPALIANGVTGVRDMGGDLDQIDKWRSEIARGTRVGPPIIRACPFVDGPKNMSPFRASVTVVVNNAEEARRAVVALKQRDVDFIKVHNGISHDAYLALADECRKQGIPLATHLPRSVRAAEASDAGTRSLEHTETLLESVLFGNPERVKSPQDAMIEFDDERAAELFTRFSKNGTWFVPTLVGYRAFASAGENKEAIAGRQTLLQRFIQLVGAMQRAGVGVLAATDFAHKDGGPRPGFDLHDELALFVKAGMTPMQALQTATHNPAQFLGMQDSLGTVEKGKLADLVLLDANPLMDIHNTQKINAVVVNGRYLSRSELDKMLAQVEAAANKH